MRTVLLATAAMLCMSGAAFAQNSTGSPLSSTASNISGSNTKSAIAPRLPLPPEDEPDTLLRAAQSALARGRTGAAQEALERAETRLLDRSTAPADASTPISGPRIDAIKKALMALSTGDRAGAKADIAMAMSHPSTGTAPMTTGSMGSGSMGSGTMAPGSTMAPMSDGSMTPAAATPMTPPVNPAGKTGGTGNQGASP